MSDEELLIEYLNGKKDIKDVCLLHGNDSCQFVPYFLNFIHTSCGKLLENKKETASPSAKDNPLEENAKKKPIKKLQICEGLNHENMEPVVSHKPQSRVTYKNKNTVVSNGKPLKDGFPKRTPVLFPVGDRKALACKGKSPKLQICFKKNTTSALSQYDISSSADFPTLTSKNSMPSSQPAASINKKNVRRIKPTFVSVDSTWSNKTVFYNDHNNEKGNFAMNSKSTELVKLERESLLKKRIASAEKLESFSQNLSQDKDEFDHVHLNNSPLKKDDTVTPLCLKKLSRLAEIHSHCVMNCIVPSCVAELHLLIMLLLLDDESCSKVSQDSDALSSTLDCAVKGRLFAALSLQLLCSEGVLRVFNDETLSLLCTHLGDSPEPRIKLLQEKLQDELHFRTIEKNQNVSNNGMRPVDNAVHFKPDLDDRSNFKSDRGFYSFRKQRDMFYTLLRQWKNRKTGEFSTEFIGKIRWLLREVKSQSTFEAFLRLFVDHLLCFGTSLDSTVNGPANNFPLATLLNGDSEKFRRLENRVTKPDRTQATSPNSWLHKKFQFFKDFVTIADSYQLNVRLCDVLQSRIADIEMEAVQVHTSSSGETTGDSHSVTEAMYKLRILGSFYAFLVFFPYDDAEERNRLSHVETVAAEFIIKSLRSAFKSGHLLLTTPWVVQFMQGSNAPCVSTTTFQSIFGLLCGIYRFQRCELPVKLPAMLNLFLGAVIGSLFEQDFVNDDSFYRNVGALVEPQREPPPDSVDGCSERILTRKLVYEMHWRLGDIQSLLQYKTTSLSKRQLPKKITPSTEKLPATAHLQTKLEANFFRNQPLSLQRTVTFVSERCHSNCIKHLCSTVLPAYCTENETKLRNFVKEAATDTQLKDSAIFRKVTERFYRDAQAHVRSAAADFTESNIIRCMKVLVSATTNEAVVEVASEIAKRSSLNTVCAWLNQRLFEHVLSRVKATLKAQCHTERKSDESERLFNVSSLLNTLNEYVIHNHEAETGDLTDVVCEQLTTICGILFPSETNTIPSNFPPGHVCSVISFLISELLVQSSSTAIKCPSVALHRLPIDDAKKTALENFLQSHQ